MKATGITRGIDKMGRVVIPKEIRAEFGFFDDAQVEFFVDTKEQRLIIQKYQRGCSFCGEMDGLIQHESLIVCEDCIGEMAEKIKK